MNDPVKIILFDLGRVLMHIDFDAFPNGLGLFTESQRAPYITPTGKLWRAYETGKMSTDEFLESMESIFGRRFSKEEILEAWNGIIVCDNEEIVPFVHAVRKKYRTAILSNTSPSHWEKILRVSSVVHSIPHHFTSFDIGAMKPEKIAYDHVARSLQVTPHEILFIDDLSENIEGAVSAGLHGIIFKNAAQLDVDFRLFEKNNHLK